jgi:penicillin amidase
VQGRPRRAAPTDRENRPLAMTKRFLFLIPVLVLLLLSAPPASAAEADLASRARAVLSQTSGTIRVAGLSRPVTVLRDPWGIPHIYAETQRDLFFAQGFVAAQDRLWQLEMWRRAGMGEMAEVLGPEALDRDRFARLLRYRGDLEAEYESYAPDAKEIIESFVRGVNAWIEVSRGRWPIEFQLTGIEPEPWTPEVVLSRVAAWEVTVNAGSEVGRALLGQKAGWDLADEILPTDPPRPLNLEPRADLDGIDQKVFALPRSLRAPVQFPDGSNNWVVDGALSATGKPLLANDPHRGLRVPSLRWLVHLVGPGWNVIGAGEPALPGVAAGHNDRVGFGFTVVGIDQQDLYVEQTHPRHPDRYLYQGRWERMRVERERIAVKGKRRPVTVELKFTAHGPVIHEDRKRRRAWVLRWVGSEPGTAGYLASLSLNRARSWPEFQKALERWKVPSENLLYADVDGNIGWQVAGLTPVRRGWSGLLPVPGDGRYEWEGFLPASELPAAFNPPSHFLATANHNILPPGYPHALAFDWGEPSRFHRLAEVLGTPKKKFTVADFERLQHDEVSLPARRIVALLREVAGVSGELRPFADLLLGWDGTVGRDSAAAALYEVWMTKLPAAVVGDRLPEDVRPLAQDQLAPERLAELLREPSSRWFGEDPRAGRDAAVVASLEKAVAEVKEKLGADPAAWRWGALHKLTLRHPLATDAERKALFDVPPVELGGDGNTVNVRVGGGYDVGHGASFREILDVADWDRSVATSVPGQSGQPGSPHYGDLLPLWAEGRYFPLLFSREAVEGAAKERLVLEPAE